MVDEKQLVAQAQQGHREAIAALYGAHQARIYRYIAYRAGRAAADDLTAEVFVAMVRHIGRYEERGRPFLAWLYAIAGNVVKMHFRNQNQTEYSPLEDELVDQGPAPADVADRRLTQGRLLAAMPALTPDQREVILLKFMEGFSNAEAAAVMGKTEGAIRVLQHRALSALRRALVEEVQHGAA